MELSRNIFIDIMMVKHQVKKADITVKGNNKYFTLMRNAIKYKKNINFSIRRG